MEEFGEVLKELRVEHGVTQRQLAAALSVDPTTISQYENGKRSFPIALLEPTCDYLGISIWEYLKRVFPEAK